MLDNWHCRSVIFKAFDEDLGENGKVTYKILTYSRYLFWELRSPAHWYENAYWQAVMGDIFRLFSIDDNGIVRLAASGDSYTKSEYLINVQAMDSGRSPRTANVVAVITIENLPGESKNLWPRQQWKASSL